jgi:hypothetical protein
MRIASRAHSIDVRQIRYGELGARGHALHAGHGMCMLAEIPGVHDARRLKGDAIDGPH